jgi:hypothetical protein
MRIAIDIPDEIHARLKARAKEEGTTMAAIILPEPSMLSWALKARRCPLI